MPFVRKRGPPAYYRNNIADVQQSNPRKWWSAVLSIAGLSSTKSVTTLSYEGQTYSAKDLANLFNDKFIYDPLFLPCTVLPWLSTYFLLIFISPLMSLLRRYFHPSSIHLLAQTKFLLGCSVRMPHYCSIVSPLVLYLQCISPWRIYSIDVEVCQCHPDPEAVFTSTRRWLWLLTDLPYTNH